NDVAVLIATPADGEGVTGPHQPRVLGLDGSAVETISADALRDRLAKGSAGVIDLGTSREYRTGHIPGAWFAIRSRLAEALPHTVAADPIVLTSPDGVLAHLAAADLADYKSAPVLALEGGTAAWVRAGLPLEAGATRMASEPVDVVLLARERGQNREE